MRLVTYDTRAALMGALADTIADELRALLARQERVTLSVPGGSTPGPIFDALSATDLAWSRVDVILNDERWVDESSDRSNTAMIKARLLKDHAANATLVPLYEGSATAEEGLPKLQDAVADALPLGVLLLGMGADMHTASLFPKADQLALGLSDEAPHLLAMRADGAPEPRITLSAPALKSARHTHVLITGDEKMTALKQAETLAEIDAPIAAFLPQATVHWAP